MATVKGRQKPGKRDRTLSDRLMTLMMDMKNERATPGLWILSNATPKIDKWDRIIIWEGWEGVPFRSRPEIAIEATEPLYPQIRDETYTIVCLTPDEAISLGYFPFRVDPVTDDLDDRTTEAIERALRDEGAIETSEGLQLRFMSFKKAQEAFLRLQQKVPGPYRTIVEEVVRDS